MKYVLLFFISLSVKADFEVIKPDFSHKKINLTIIQAYPDSWQTYKLVNHNSRVMTLVCRNNRVYGNNTLPFIEYRNFYNEIAARFTFPSNKVCLDLGEFIENIHMGISQSNPLEILLTRKNLQVARIIYPNIDPLDDTGDISDLFPKKKIILTYPYKNKDHDINELDVQELN
jgi:hypothetical protein